jgi:3'-phosphoadenosine 5'-phosphosulfate sulfotransferase (PAPS reductase)/FAD synthetase
MKTIVSFSGGKDSTAMLLRMIELGEHIDEVLCCDTYKEFPAMYRHIEKVKKVVEEAGIKFTMLRSEKSFDYYMFEHIPNRRNKNLNGRVGYSWAGHISRWCTSKLKIDVMNKYLSELKREHNVIRCIGIAADEQYRLERQYASKDGFMFPLVEWGWTERDCIEYCYSRGYDWEGLYEIFRKQEGRCPRVSCWCCPLQPLEDLRILRSHFPDLWKELRDMGRRTWRTFKTGYSVEDLETRFAFEEERLSQGLSITSREFHSELKKRIEERRAK